MPGSRSSGAAFVALVFLVIVVVFTLMGQALQNSRDEDRERENNPTPSISAAP